MLKILIMIGLSLASFASFAQVKVEYRVSEPLGLIDFVMAISGEPHHAPAIRQVFLTSQYNTPETQEKIRQIESMQKSLSKEIDFNTSFPGRSQGVTVRQLIETQSLFSKNLQDLSQRSLGLLPKSEHAEFFNILNAFDPIYQDLIWKKHRADLLVHQRKLETLGRKIDLNGLFAKAESFYRAQWPKGVPFVIGLYPVPFLKGSRNSTNSSSIGSVEIHGVLVGDKLKQSHQDINGSFGVIFHELCHSLYDSQTESFMKEFDGFFLSNQSPYRMQGYDWINEALATAIGNGWAAEIANKGRKDEGSWYNHPIIDGFAKEIYPLTKKYLDEGRQMDKNFVDQAISIFAKKFPDSIYQFSSLFNAVTLISNDSIIKNTALKKSLRDSFQIWDLESNSRIAAEETKTAIKASSSSVILVFSQGEISDVEKLAQGIPFLQKQIKLLGSMKNRSIFAGLDEVGRAYVAIKAASDIEVGLAIEKLKAIEKIDLHQPVIEF
jgi:hypothetical protein